MKLSKYEKLNEANFWGYNYRYEVRSLTPSGRDYLLGGSKDIKSAEEIIKNQIKAIKDSPFEKAKDRIHRIKNIYVLDTEDESKSINLGYELERIKKDAIDALQRKNESLTEEFYFDFLNYNDYLANNFSGWDDDDIDDLIHELNVIARALGTTANKLIFYIDYDEIFWCVDDLADVIQYVKNSDASIYQMKDNGIKFACLANGLVWVFKGEGNGSKVISAVEKHCEELDEELVTNPDKKINGIRLEGLVDISDDFKIARENWNKLNLGISFDDALEEWNKESNMAEPVHFYAKPVYSIKAWENMIQFFKDKADEVPGESHVKHKEEEEENVDLPDEEMPEEQVDFNQEMIEN